MARADLSDRPTFDPHPVTLELADGAARLETLDLRHAADLVEAGDHPQVWLYLPRPAFRDQEDCSSWIAEALAAQAAGDQLPFAIVERKSGKAIGSTRYLEIRRRDRAIEIGWTWINPAYQRSSINTECKLLLLEHAFERHGALRVQLKTDRRNKRSQTAIERIGAKKEGVLRQHMIAGDGALRDSVYYSILDSEWPAVRAKLEGFLDR